MGKTLSMLGYLKAYLTFLCENHFYILSYQKNLEDLKNGKNNFTLKPIYNLQNMTVTKPPMTLQKFRAQKYDKFVLDNNQSNLKLSIKIWLVGNSCSLLKCENLSFGF